MGWFGTYTEYANSAEYAEHELKAPEGFNILERVVKKDTHYTAVAYTLIQNCITGAKTILIDFIDKDGNHWSHKPFSESSGPCVYTCPKSMLNKSDCNESGAIEWRKKCQEAQSGKTSAKKQIIDLFKQLKRGTIIRIGESVLEFAYIYNKTGTQIACKNETGELFRYGFDQFTAESLKNAIASNP